MNLDASEVQLLAIAIVVLLIFGMYLLVRWTRSKKTNTEVWGTIFESFSHYVQPQASLKEPKQEIRKQKRESGDDKDKND